MGILKNYNDGMVVSEQRFNQIQNKWTMICDLLSKKLIGYVVYRNLYWIVFWEDERYWKTPFARNREWFNALTSNVEFHCIRNLPQIYII